MKLVLMLIKGNTMKLLSILILLSTMAFGQSGKSVLSESQKDSINQMMRDSLSYNTPEKYGAITLSNDATAFTAMFNASGSQRIVLKSNEDYNISSYQISYLNANDVVVDGNNATIDMNSYFLTITSGSSWTDAAHTGFSNSTLQTKARANTLFSTDFVKDSLWVGIQDTSDWDLDKGDMLFFSDSTTAGNSDYNGGAFVIERIDNLYGRIYFQQPIRRTIEKAKALILRTVDCSGKKIVIKNLNIINGGLRVSGFENVLIENCNFSMDSTTWQSLNISLDGNTQSVTGLTTFWNKKVTIRDCFAEGYLIVGNGYGIDVGMGDRVIIDNLEGRDCRHIVTTSNATGGGVFLNNLDIVNSSAYFSKRAYEVIPSNQTAFDTHVGTDWLSIDNCKVYNAEMVVKLRGENVSINRVDAYNTRYIVTLSDGGISSTYKRSAKITNSNFENFETMIALENCQVSKVELTNVSGSMLDNTVDGGGYPNAVVYAASTSGNIDSLIINNCKFTNPLGSGSNSAYLMLSSSTDRNIIVNTIIENSKFDDLISGISLNKTNWQNLLFRNNVVEGVNRFISAGALDTSDGYLFGEWIFQGNTFNSVSSMLYESYPIKINNWKFIGNIFNGCTNVFVYESTKVEDVLIANNVIKNPVGNLVRMNGSGSGIVNFNNNQVNCGTSIQYISSITGYNKINAFNNVFLHYAPSSGQTIITGNGTFNFTNNHFQIDSSDYNYLMTDVSGATQTFMKNTFEVTGTKYLFNAVDASITSKDNDINFSGVDGRLNLNDVESDSTVLQVGEVFDNGDGILRRKGEQNIYTSNFSAGVDNWAKLSDGILAGNIDAILDSADCLRLTAEAGFNNMGNSTIVTPSGMEYDISFDYYVPSASLSPTYFSIFGNTTAIRYGDDTYTITKGSWQTITITGVTSGGDGLKIYVYPNPLTASDLIYFKNIKVDLK